MCLKLYNLDKTVLLDFHFTDEDTDSERLIYLKLPSWEKPEFKTKSILTQPFHFQEVSYTNVQEYRPKDGHYSSL